MCVWAHHGVTSATNAAPSVPGADANHANHESTHAVLDPELPTPELRDRHDGSERRAAARERAHDGTSPEGVEVGVAGEQL